MASLNRVMLIGNVGKDPDLKFSPSGMAVCRFSVATTDVWMDKASGEKKDRVEWHRILVFNKLAENCGKYLTKGRQVYIEGSLQTTSYEKDGITRYSTEIKATTVQFLGQNQGQGQGQSQNSQGQYQQKGQSQQQGSYMNQADDSFYSQSPDDDIPF